MVNTIPTSTTFTLNAGQFITRAYRMMGMLPSGGAPTDDEMTQGIIAFNGMLKGWQADGVNLFRQSTFEVTFGPGEGGPDNPITLTPLIMKLENATWVQTPAPNLYERPLNISTYMDYQVLPNKMTRGAPSTIMFSKETRSSDLYLFPVPLNGGTIKVTVQRSVLDVTQASDEVDIPYEWQQGVTYGLADCLMEDQGLAAADPATAQRISDKAQEFYAKLLRWDVPDSIFFRPQGKAGSGKLYR